MHSFTCIKYLLEPEFHLSRHVTHVSRRACSNMADDEEAVVFACTSLVFCALDLHQSSQEQLREKSELSTPVYDLATPLNTCRACRDERVAPCCPTSATASAR